MTEPLGLSASQKQLVQGILLTVLAQKESYVVCVFGSRARGEYRRYSDLDLWIESEPSLQRSEEEQLREQLVASDLPIKVDIVTPESCLEAYRDSIANEKKVWFSK